MLRPTDTRPNARELAVGVSIAVAMVLAASAAVFLFDLHPAVMAFGMFVGSSLGLVQSRRMAIKRLAAATGPDAR